MARSEGLNSSDHMNPYLCILQYAMPVSNIIMAQNSRSVKFKGYEFLLRFLSSRWKPSVIFVRILLALLEEETVELAFALQFVKSLF